MSIKEFLDGKPSLTQILQYIETEARKEAERRKAQAGANP